jgi:hypothetical protein
MNRCPLPLVDGHILQVIRSGGFGERSGQLVIGVSCHHVRGPAGNEPKGKDQGVKAGGNSGDVTGGWGAGLPCVDAVPRTHKTAYSGHRIAFETTAPIGHGSKNQDIAARCPLHLLEPNVCHFHFGRLFYSEVFGAIGCLV